MKNKLHKDFDKDAEGFCIDKDSKKRVADEWIRFTMNASKTPFDFLFSRF